MRPSSLVSSRGPDSSGEALEMSAASSTSSSSFSFSARRVASAARSSGGTAASSRFHELKRGYEPGIRGAHLPRLQRGEAQVEQDGDHQQSTGEHHVGADEQPAMAGLQPLLHSLPSFPGVGH